MVKKYIRRYANHWGIFNLTKKLKRGATVLFYHGVQEIIVNRLVQELFIPLDQFKKQIQYLRNNFEIVSLDYLYDCIVNNYRITPSQVLITFDDGYKNNINVAAPILKSYNVPFSVFISTNHIDRGHRFPTYYLRTGIFYTEHKHLYIPSINNYFDISTEGKRISTIKLISKILKSSPQDTVRLLVDDLIRLLPAEKWLELNNLFFSDEPMNWDEVIKLHDTGVIIGSHCHDHAVLHSNQNNSEIDFQLKTSKDMIEKHLGKCKYFSYPNGRMDNIAPYSLISAEKNNYLLGFSTVRGEIGRGINNHLILPRICAPFDMDSFNFVMSTSFLYNNRYNRWSQQLSGFL